MKKIDKTFKILLLVILIISIHAAAEARILVRDNWDSSGKLFLDDANWTGVFSKEKGALLVYSKLKQDKLESMKIIPFYSEEVKAESIISCKVVADEERETEIRVVFSAGQNRIVADFLFSQDGTIQIKPFENMKGVSIFSPIEYGVLPSRYLIDNIYDSKNHPSASELYVPSESIFMGLLKGRSRILVCAWPADNQKVKLLLKDGKSGEHLIQAVEIELDSKSIYLGILTAPGIWHQEELLPSYLGKDILIDWKRPFSARWKTQLFEDGKFELSYPFREKKKGRHYEPRLRGARVRSDYIYPVWFEEEKAFFHFNRVVPPVSPSGKAFIYALEGKNTPMWFAKNCIGVISVFKELKRIPNRPGNHVNINWCNGRNLLNKIFKETRAGIHIRERELLKDIMDDFRLAFLVIKERLEEYDNFILKTEELIDSWSKQEKDKQELQYFFNDMKNHLNELRDGYRSQMKGLTPQEAYQYDIVEVVEKLEGIFEDDSLEIIYPAVYYYLYKIKMWGAHHSGGRVFSNLAFKLYQQAGHSCAENKAAVKYAEEIRKRIRELRIGRWQPEIIQ